MFVFAKRILLSALMMGLSGCGTELPPDQRQVFPASGKVSFQGKPIPDATVRLHPVKPPDDGKPVYISRGRVEDGGEYSISTYAIADGAPAGQYRVSLSWQGPLKGLSEDEVDQLRERLPRKYTSPETSGLTVMITEDQNRIPEITIQ